MTSLYLNVVCLLLLWPQLALTVKVDDEFVQCKEYQTSKTVMDNDSFSCMLLQRGQYYCADPEIDNKTQQAVGCSKDYQYVEVPCYPVAGINCSGVQHTGQTVAFCKLVPCKWTNGKRFEIALLLSVFLGWLGIDRFYLGYPALGLVKFCTFGFMLLWHLVDILLIAIQVVGPADGSHYVIDYFGAGLTQITRDDDTYIKQPDDLS